MVLPAPRHCGHVRGDREEALLRAHLALAAALEQVVGEDAGRRARPLQVSQASWRGIWIVVSAPVRRLVERDFEVVAEVGAALRPAAAAAAAEQVAEAEHVAEDVGEVAELVEDRRIESGARASRCAARPRGRSGRTPRASPDRRARA